MALLKPSVLLLDVKSSQFILITLHCLHIFAVTDYIGAACKLGTLAP